jgi:hypothetical protein
MEVIMKRKWITPILVIACVGFVLADDAGVPVADKSERGSPLENTGSVRLSETVQNGNTHFSYQADVAARNISSKTIMAVVASLDITDSQGHKVQEMESGDLFFKDNTLKPGDVLTLSYNQPSEYFVPLKYSSAQTTPSAESRTLFVQFEDGTTFGDEKYANRLMNSRQETWNALAHLNDVCTKQSQAACLAELQKTAELRSVDMYLQNLRRSEQQNGLEPTLEKIRATLKTAELRQQAINAQKNQ